ncbi:MAG: dehydrogenase [Clostridiales bacterium]|nr:dehydrogenase [Clostridiales bacterium]
MPKTQFLDPNEILKKGEVSFPKIPVNAYEGNGEKELSVFGKSAFVEIYRQMCVIRAFETRLDELKKFGKTGGVSYTYRGPLHLCVGQEATAVGANFLFSYKDVIFGTHRNHGEVLAKGYSAIDKMGEEELTAVMENYHNPATLQGAKKMPAFLNADGKTKARLYFLYGLFCEIFGKTQGFQKGLSGSMHMFFTPFGIYPNNAIVGGSAGIATGYALSNKLFNKEGAVCVNLGDASLGCGAVWEGMNFAAMDQFTALWQKAPGGLPIIYSFYNNQYGMGGQTVGETMAFGTLARAAAGINPDAMHAERVNGYDPFAVIDAYQRKLPLLKEGKGPVLLDLVTYRYSEHSASDSGSYRTEEEVQAWKNADPIKAFKEKMLALNVLSEKDLVALQSSAESEVYTALQAAVSKEISPVRSVEEERQLLKKVVYCEGEKGISAPRSTFSAPLPLKGYQENSRIKEIARKGRNNLTLSDGIFEGVLSAFYQDNTLIAYGEENRDWGNVSGVYVGLTEALPYERLFNAPISESAIISTAVGFAMGGGRALVEIMFMDFAGRATDEIINQLAKWRTLSGGEFHLPVTVRTAIGRGYGAQHSQDLTALYCHIPGLKVVYPATPYDAKGLITACLNEPNPVLFIENQSLYKIVGNIPVPEGEYQVPIGKAQVVAEGDAVTLLSVGSCLPRVISAAERLKGEGISAEVIDARTLVPFDFDTLEKSVRKTGRVVFVSDETGRGAYVKELAATLTERAFGALKAPPVFICAGDTAVPLAGGINAFYPQTEEIINTCYKLLNN